MKTIRPSMVIIAFVFAFACKPVPATKGPKGLSEPSYNALQEAVSAFDRANEYRDAGVILYEPRYLDAERAADSVKNAAHELIDVSASLKARHCVTTLKIYRLDLSRLQVVVDSDSRASEVSLARKSLGQDGAEIDSCIREAKGML